MQPIVAAAREWLKGGEDAGGIALVLSGGGFRATLFHLGVLRHLAETGQLARVTHVTSVSGGSILAAHLVLHWDEYTGTPEQFDGAERRVLAFVRRDVRGRVVRRWLAGCLIPIPFLCRRLARFPGLGFLAAPGEIGTLRHLLQRHYERGAPGDWPAVLAGCRGACQTVKGGGKWFMPKGNPFAVLLRDDVFREFVASAKEGVVVDTIGVLGATAEDPATGSASGPLGCYLVRHGLVPLAQAGAIVSAQGVKMNRPSRVHIRIDASAPDAITRVRVGGTSVLVGEGRLRAS